MAEDYLSSCIDEIALEGLDGITVDALWTRLNDRRPTFPLSLDEQCKSFLWRIVSTYEDLTFYELPTARGELVLNDRFQHTDPATGIFLEQQDLPEEIYPLEIISDQNIVGSCTTYKTRKDVTSKIRTSDLTCLLTLEEVRKRWGRKLVIVASQELRTGALYGPEVDPSLVLPEKQYCILERIGRSRRQGEITQGKQSLLIFGEASKTIFYLRKVLVRHNLITVQPFNQKLSTGLNSTGKCLHLKRFFVEYKPVYLGLLENLTSRLLQKPKHREVLTVLRSEMNMRDCSFKKLYQFGHKYVKTEMVPHKEFYPDSTKEEYMVKCGTKERFVRVLTLKKPYRYTTDAKSDDEDGSEDEDVGTNVKDEHWTRVVELPLLHQAYQFARSKGEMGASQNDFRQAFLASKLDGRLMARNLDRLGVVKSILQDQGKQRVQMFVAKEFIAGSTLHKKLQEEKDKIVKLTLPKQETSGACTPMSSQPGSPQHPRTSSPAPGTSGAGLSSADLDLSGLDDSVPLIDSSNIQERHNNKKKGAHVTYRLLKRANYVLKAVQEAKLVDNIFQIQKKIIEDEAAEGYACRCDKKSLLRLVERLARDGQIKSIKTLIKFGEEEKQLHFLCDPSISATDQIVTSAIEAAKLRHVAMSKNVSKDAKKLEKSSEQGTGAFDVTTPNYGLLRSNLLLEDLQYDADAGRRYGYKPRMIRLQLVHTLLFYLVYDYDVEAAIVTALLDKERKEGEAMDDSVTEAKVYCDEMSWRRFIPPLPKHREYEKGWCLIGDVLLRLPVFIFCQIIRVNFKIPGLQEMLDDPVRRFLTVGQLPSNMRQQLMIERKYIFSFYNNCVSLCLMGLLTFGKREWKQKEQIFIYINQNAKLLDTTETDEPLESKPVHGFHFKDNTDVENYWFKLQWICLNTPIDAIVIYADPKGINHSNALKIERFAEHLEGRLPEEIQDTGTLPGNLLGAAGLDSTFFGHLRRNWSASSGNLRTETLISEGKRKLVEEGRNVVKRPRSKKKRGNEEEVEVEADIDEGRAVESVVAADKPPEGDLSLLISRVSDKKSKDSGPSSSEKPQKKVEAETKRVTVPGGKAPKGGKGIKRKAHDPAAGSTSTRDTSEEGKKKTKLDGKTDNTAGAQPTAPAQAKKKKLGPKKNEMDSVDRDALKRMTKERVMWTPQEDSLLLLCEVASSILGGLRRDFLVPFTTVRDLMHKNFTTALDKTSKACQRRIRYILKNPETVANVTVYKGEALQDKSIVEEFVTGKKYHRNPKNAAELNAIFNRLVERLRDKFKSCHERTPLKLPDTLEEVYRRFTLSRPAVTRKSEHQEVTSEKDIHFSVLHNVIHSAMVIRDKTGHANELYHVFSQYPDNLLQAVFNQMRADGIVTKIKAYAANKDPVGKRTMAGPSVAIGNYQMAQRYTYKWFSRFRKSVFLQSYSLLSMVCGDLNDSEQVDSKRTDVQEKENTEPTPENGADDDPTNVRARLTPMKDEGVYVAFTVALLVQRKLLLETCIPDQVIIIESQYASKQKRDRRTKKFADMEKELHIGTASDEEEEALIEEAEKARESQTEDTLPVSSDMDGGSKKTTSRTSLVLFRSQYANGPVSVRMLAPQDHIVINSCLVRFMVPDHYSFNTYVQPEKIYKTAYDNGLYHHQWNKVHFWLHSKTCARTLAAIRKVEPQDVDENAFYHACAQRWGFSMPKIRHLRRIFDEVRQSGILGLAVQEVQARHGHCAGLDRMLEALAEHHMVRRVGVTEPRLVSYDNLTPWLVHSFKNIKGRLDIPEKKVGPHVPVRSFTFGSSDEEEIEDDPTSDIDDVPPPPSCTVDAAYRLVAPPTERYRIFSHVRSVIMEERTVQSVRSSGPARAEEDTSKASSAVPSSSSGTTQLSADRPETVSTDEQIKSPPEETKQQQSLVSSTEAEIETTTVEKTPGGHLSCESVEKSVPEAQLDAGKNEGAETERTTTESQVTVDNVSNEKEKVQPETSLKRVPIRLHTSSPCDSDTVKSTTDTTGSGESEIGALSEAAQRTAVTSPTAKSPPPTSSSQGGPECKDSPVLEEESASLGERPVAPVPERGPAVEASSTDAPPVAVKVSRMASVLTTRALPSLAGRESRTRSSSECGSDSQPAEPQGTMVRLLEGIAEHMQSSSSTSAALVATPKGKAVQSPTISAKKVVSPAPTKLQRVTKGSVAPQAVSTSSMGASASVKRTSAQLVLTTSNKSPQPSYTVAGSSSSSSRLPVQLMSPRSQQRLGLTDEMIAQMLLEPQDKTGTSTTSTSSSGTAGPTVSVAAKSTGRLATGGPVSVTSQLKYASVPKIPTIKSHPPRQESPRDLTRPMPTLKAALKMPPMVQQQPCRLTSATNVTPSSQTAPVAAASPIRKNSQKPDVGPSKMPSGDQGVSETGERSGGGTFIEVPVQNVVGFGAVGSALGKQPGETVRIKLPPGVRMPSSRGPIRVSVISEEQARRMGLALPPGAVSATRTLKLPNFPGSTVPGATQAKPAAPTGEDTSKSNEASAGSAEQEGGREEDQTLPQVDGAGDDKEPGGVQQGNNTGEAGTKTAGKQTTLQTKSNEQAPSKATPSTSSSSAKKEGRYSIFPKFKGRTPESTLDVLYQRLRLIPRPWRQTDGLVNKPTLKLMLESVLILVMTRPGITYTDVTTQYNPILQPVPVLELLEILEDLGCIRTVYITRSHTCDLFSKRVEVNAVSAPTQEKTFIPAVDCVLKLGQFEAQLTAGVAPKIRDPTEEDYMEGSV